MARKEAPTAARLADGGKGTGDTGTPCAVYANYLEGTQWGPGRTGRLGRLIWSGPNNGVGKARWTRGIAMDELDRALNGTTDKKAAVPDGILAEAGKMLDRAGETCLLE